MANTVFCIVTAQPQASDIVDRLKSSGFLDNDISVRLPEKKGTRDFGHEKHTKARGGSCWRGRGLSGQKHQIRNLVALNILALFGST